MKKKQQFIKPGILRELCLLGDGPILKGSITDDTVVVSVGQTVTNIDAGNTKEDWNNQWEW